MLPSTKKTIFSFLSNLSRLQRGKEDTFIAHTQELRPQGVLTHSVALYTSDSRECTP